MNFLTLLCLSIFVTASFGFFIDDFKANENSSIISTLDISIDSSQKGLEFPNYFTAIITDLITKKVLFVKINKTNDKYPIASDDVYTLDSKKKLVKVSLFSANNEPYEVYKSQDGKSVATLIKNADSSANPYRMLATINTDESKDLTYNVLPIIDRTKSPKKRILASSSGHVSYDSKLNSHAIIRNTLKDFKFNDQPKLTENIKVIEKKTSRNKRSNNGVPFNLVVEYLVVVDSSVYNDHVTYAQSTNSDLVYQYIRTYFAHYVNSINQRYLNSFQNDADLRISVKLKNILIFQNQADCPWTDPNQVGISFYSTYNNKQVIAIDKTLNAFSSYMNSQTFNFTFDHAIALFDKDLWDSSQVANPSSASQVVGYSPIKGICTNSKYSLGEEIGGFRNAIVAAHELGHNLGAYHDGTLGDQFSTGCSASDNYLMTAGLNTYPLDSTNFANNLRLSSCSVNSIKSNLLSNSYTIVSTNGQCLTDFSGNAPYDYLINGNVPGQFFTANDQCKQIYGTSSGTCQYSSSSICYNLFCRDSSGNCVGTGVGAAPGTTCDSGKACISNSCTNSSLALTSDCPFGDDTIYDTEIQAVLGFLTPKLPSFSSLTSKFTCEAALDYYSANGFSKTAFCQDKRTSAYFKTTCCATCQRYAQLSCFDQLYECPSLKNQCSSTVTVLGVTNTVLFFCPRTCSACTGQLTCANNICKNGATCNNITTTSLTAFTCSCPNGYSGSLCEIKNPCLPNPCNTGVCQQFGSLGYVCSCLSGYSGYNCNVAPDGSVVTTTTPILTTTTTTTTAFPTFCSPNPCQNGGTCVNGATTYGCICFSGFTGPNCATTIANCAANPCQNGGTCTNLIGSTGYTCKCLAGYSGVNCEKSYICDPNPCSNGGTCVQISATSAYCKCPSGVTGALCQFGSNVCTSKPCLNNGACNVLSTGGYSCTCQSGYYGSNCQYSGYNPCSSTTCQNGGSCTVTNAYPYYYCTCQSGYTGTNCQTMITTTTLSPSNCVDKNPINCAFYASSNFCKDNYYVQGMTVPTYCPKSCNRCSFTTTTTASPSGCYDTYSACNTWAASNYCKLYPVYLYCRKACSLC